MSKIIIFIYLFISLLSGISFADSNYKIVVKVNDQIISNHDIEREVVYLSALNPKILSISKNEIQKIAKNSLIREIVKETEILKHFNNDTNLSPDLTNPMKNIYSRLNISTEAEFNDYLTKFNLELENVREKLSIELNWNAMIYQLYKNKINIDRDKIKENLELESTDSKIKKMFLISEIVFTAKNKEGFDSIYQKIVDSIEQKGFKSTATIYSLSDTAQFDGKIGWVGKGDVSKEIYQNIYNLKINEFSKPLKIGAGFIIINLDAVKEEEQIINLEKKFDSMVSKEMNRQLTQHSSIHYKKIEKQSFIYGD